MEISTAKTELLDNKHENESKTKQRVYIAIIIVFGAIILTLLIVNLWQAGYLESDEDTVSIVECSGNGHSYNDLNECECFQCYSGDACQMETVNCTISAGSGNPFLLFEYWTEQVRKNKIKPMIIEADWRMGYDYSLFGPFSEKNETGLGGEVNQIIRSLHSKYHNVDLTDSYIVFGPGGTGIQTAAYAAYSGLLQTQIIAFADVPSYFGYPSSCQAAGVARCVFNSSRNLVDDGRIIEFVTFPNNPDGEERERFYTNSIHWAYDLVYYWPHYIAADELVAMDAPVSFFSITKLTGHASSRFGWAVVKNLTVANAFATWIQRTQMVMTVESVRRAYELLGYLVDNGDEFFEFIKRRMDERFELLLDVLSDQNNYVLSSRVGTFFAWIECVNKTEEEIMDLFGSYRLSPSAGSGFGQPGFVRMSMAQFEGNFKKMMERFRLMVDNER